MNKISRSIDEEKITPSNKDESLQKKKKALFKRGVITVCLLPGIAIIRFLLSIVFFMLNMANEGGSASGPDPYALIKAGLNWLLGVFALISLILLPFGIYWIITSKKMTSKDGNKKLMQLEEYKDLTEDQVDYIQGFSRPAFLFPVTRALGNRLRARAFGSIIPIFNLYVRYKLSLYGKSIARKQSKRKSFEGFKKTQQVLLGVNICMTILIFIVNFIQASNQNDKISNSTQNTHQESSPSADDTPEYPMIIPSS